MLDMKVVSERKEREKGCVAAKKVRKCVRVCGVTVMNGSMSHYCVCVSGLRCKQEPQEGWLS